MNPLYLTIFHTVVGRKRLCSSCGKVQVVERLDSDQRYHCKYCGQSFLPLKPRAEAWSTTSCCATC